MQFYERGAAVPGGDRSLFRYLFMCGEYPILTLIWSPGKETKVMAPGISKVECGVTDNVVKYTVYSPESIRVPAVVYRAPRVGEGVRTREKRERDVNVISDALVGMSLSRTRPRLTILLPGEE